MEICIGDILWGYVVWIRWLYRHGDTTQTYVGCIGVWIRYRHTLQTYVGCIGLGIHRRDTFQTYVGRIGVWIRRRDTLVASVVGVRRSRCTAVRVVYLGTSLGGVVCQEHKSVPMTNLGLSLSYLVVMYVYIIAHFTAQFQPA